MKLAILGHGKMGKAIEAICKQEDIVPVIVESSKDLSKIIDAEIDVAIEFTDPSSAFANISYCLKNGVSVVSGTTGWLENLPQVKELCMEVGGTFLHTSNFSIGANLFFEMNEWLAKKMASLNFTPSLSEIHHTEKKDSPSGTAITLANDILKNNETLKYWVNKKSNDPQSLEIISERISNVPGTHTVNYTSQYETIEIIHTAHNRRIFAHGALQVAKWICDKKGFFTISDYINSQ